MHADNFFQRFDLDVALREVSDATDQATFVEDDVELVAVAFFIQGVVDDWLEHALIFEFGIFGGAFFQHCVDFEEVETVEHDGAGHLRLRELRGFGISFCLLTLFSVECAYETFANFLAYFA